MMNSHTLEAEAYMVCRASSRTTRAMKRIPVRKKRKRKKKTLAKKQKPNKPSLLALFLRFIFLKGKKVETKVLETVLLTRSVEGHHSLWMDTGGSHCRFSLYIFRHLPSPGVAAITTFPFLPFPHGKTHGRRVLLRPLH